MTTPATPDNLYSSPVAGSHAGMQQSAPPVVAPSTALTQVSSWLGAILLLIVFIGWLVKRAGFAPQARNNKLLKVTASCQVGRGERVVIVEVDNTWLVLGVTATQITPLHQLSAPPASLPTDDENSGEKPADFVQLLQKALKRPGK